MNALNASISKLALGSCGQDGSDQHPAGTCSIIQRWSMATRCRGLVETKARELDQKVGCGESPKLIKI